MKSLKRISFNSKVILRNKRVILNLFMNYLKLIMGGKVLRTLILSIEDRCQLDCKHCSSKNLQNPNRKKLDFNLIKKVIDQAKEIGAISVTLTGGEPLLNKKIYKILRYIKKRGLISNINTNGLLLTNKTCKKLKEAGIGNLTISLDFLSKEKHDSFRNKKGVFNKVMKAIKNSKEYNIPFLISSVVSHETLMEGETEAFLKFAGKKGWEITLSPAAKVGKWEKKDYLLLHESDQEILRDILNKPNVRSDKEGCYLNKGCSAGTEIIHVSCYGDVTPCDFIQISFGNVKHENLKKIWNKMHQVSYFKSTNKYCLPAEDSMFIKQFLDPFIGKPKPIKIEDYPKKVLHDIPKVYNQDPFCMEKNPYLKGIMEYSFSQLFNKKYESLLEIGSGCGFYFPILSKYGKRIVCIDENPNMTDLSKKIIAVQNLKNIDCYIGDATNLKFKNNSFDCILGYDVLHHVDYKKAIKEIYRVLKKGGVYLGIEPNVFNLLIFFLQLKDRIEWGAFKCNKYIIAKMFAKQFAEVKIGRNNVIQTGVNKFSLPVIKIVDNVNKIPLIKSLSFNYTILAKK